MIKNIRKRIKCEVVTNKKRNKLTSSPSYKYIKGLIQRFLLCPFY